MNHAYPSLSRGSPVALDGLSDHAANICEGIICIYAKKKSELEEKKFVDAFKKHYRPGLFGGHWNRPFLKRPMTMGSIKAYAESYPNSATARAVKEVMTLTNQLQPPLQKPRYWYSS